MQKGTIGVKSILGTYSKVKCEAKLGSRSEDWLGLASEYERGISAAFVHMLLAVHPRFGNGQGA